MLYYFVAQCNYEKAPLMIFDNYYEWIYKKCNKYTKAKWNNILCIHSKYTLCV